MRTVRVARHAIPVLTLTVPSGSAPLAHAPIRAVRKPGNGSLATFWNDLLTCSTALCRQSTAPCDPAANFNSAFRKCPNGVVGGACPGIAVRNTGNAAFATFWNELLLWVQVQPYTCQRCMIQTY